MIIKNSIFMAVAALALCGCGQNGTKKAGQATGADRDGHDCIGSAGYQWSEARKDCIRPFEDGVKMLPTTQSDTGAVYAAYIVFSADSAQAESAGISAAAVRKAVADGDDGQTDGAVVRI